MMHCRRVASATVMRQQQLLPKRIQTFKSQQMCRKCMKFYFVPSHIVCQTSTHCEASSSSQYSHHFSRKMLRVKFWRISSSVQEDIRRLSMNLTRTHKRAHTHTHLLLTLKYTSNEDLHPSISVRVPSRCKGECGRPDLLSSRYPASLEWQTCRLTC